MQRSPQTDAIPVLAIGRRFGLDPVPDAPRIPFRWRTAWLDLQQHSWSSGTSCPAKEEDSHAFLAREGPDPKVCATSPPSRWGPAGRGDARLHRLPLRGRGSRWRDHRRQREVMAVLAHKHPVQQAPASLVPAAQVGSMTRAPQSSVRANSSITSRSSRPGDSPPRNLTWDSSTAPTRLRPQCRGSTATGISTASIASSWR